MLTIVVCTKMIRSEILYPGNNKRTEPYLLNPYDLYALEQVTALRGQAEFRIVCLCMGPETAKSAMIRCLAMGADEAVLIRDSRLSGSDTYATSYVLAAAIRRIGADMVICGEMAVDGETGQVGYGLARRLDIPCLSGVMEFLEILDIAVVARCRHDMTEVRHCELPALFVCAQFTTKEQEYSMLALKRAKKKDILLWDADFLRLRAADCGQAGSKTKVIGIEPISYERQAKRISGDSHAQALFIHQILTKQ